MFFAPCIRLSPQFEEELLPNQLEGLLLLLNQELCDPEGSHDEELLGIHDDEPLGNQFEYLELEDEEKNDVPKATPTPNPRPNTASTVDRGYSSTTCCACDCTARVVDRT